MINVQNRLPSSQPGQIMCEKHMGFGRFERFILTNPAEVKQMKKAGATLYEPRHGGWVKLD